MAKNKKAPPSSANVVQKETTWPSKLVPPAPPTIPPNVPPETGILGAVSPIVRQPPAVIPRVAAPSSASLGHTIKGPRCGRDPGQALPSTATATTPGISGRAPATVKSAADAAVRPHHEAPSASTASPNGPSKLRGIPPPPPGFTSSESIRPHQRGPPPPLPPGPPPVRSVGSSKLQGLPPLPPGFTSIAPLRPHGQVPPPKIGPAGVEKMYGPPPPAPSAFGPHMLPQLRLRQATPPNIVGSGPSRLLSLPPSPYPPSWFHGSKLRDSSWWTGAPSPSPTNAVIPSPSDLTGPWPRSPSPQSSIEGDDDIRPMIEGWERKFERFKAEHYPELMAPKVAPAPTETYEPRMEPPPDVYFTQPPTVPYPEPTLPLRYLDTYLLPTSSPIGFPHVIDMEDFDQMNKSLLHAADGAGTVLHNYQKARLRDWLDKDKYDRVEWTRTERSKWGGRGAKSDSPRIMLSILRNKDQIVLGFSENKAYTKAAVFIVRPDGRWQPQRCIHPDWKKNHDKTGKELWNANADDVLEVGREIAIHCLLWRKWERCSHARLNVFTKAKLPPAPSEHA